MNPIEVVSWYQPLMVALGGVFALSSAEKVRLSRRNPGWSAFFVGSRWRKDHAKALLLVWATADISVLALLFWVPRLGGLVGAFLIVVYTVAYFRLVYQPGETSSCACFINAFAEATRAESLIVRNAMLLALALAVWGATQPPVPPQPSALLAGGAVLLFLHIVVRTIDGALIARSIRHGVSTEEAKL